MARMVAADIPEGWYVNLGIGLPTLVADHIPTEREVILHSENGILGMGPLPAPGEADPWLVNAGKENVTLVKGAALFHHGDSFAMIRGGHLDLCVLGAFEVAENGDLANWSTSASDRVPAVGGAMDLGAGARNVWVMTTHSTKAGDPKLVSRCTYPLTALRAVKRIYSDLAVIDVTGDGFVVRDMAPGVTPAGLQELTGAKLHFR
ncbi:3-oxoacid CoA-transferase subunit B [Mesorhizobium sp. 8]|nr:3-oxoacid CoA-transferase subunit B [Mesorhizobium sp. 8]